MKNLILEKKYLYIIIMVFVSIIIFGLVYFGINKYFEYKAQKQVEEINYLLNNGDTNISNCEKVLDFDEKIIEKNEYFNKSKYADMKKQCDDIYNISHIETDEENCKDLIKQNKIFFATDYLILDDFENKRKTCIDKYLTVKFSTGSLFVVDNDFKSEIKLDFSQDFFTDIGEVNTDKYINNRTEAKKRLKDLININPQINYTIDDIYLTPNKAILRLALQPLTNYSISLKNFDTNLGEQTKNKKFIFTTPENKYFGMKILDKVTLYQKNNLPQFQIMKYNSSISNTKIKICKISEETYAKIEVYRKRAENIDVKNFFLNDIDKLEKIDCKEKEISLDNKEEKTLIKKNFNLQDVYGNSIDSGLYYVEFSNKSDREYNSKFNYPIFFGVVDSHITMKVSRNGEAFVFVNDFDGNPLENQNISLYLNDFVDLEKKYNREKGDYDVQYNSVLDKDIFGSKFDLGKTGKDGILKVNLKEKIDDVFLRTFTQDWEYDWQGLYKTFFITSSGDNNLSYLASTWNSGIAPWNFGYSVNNYGWYGDSNANQDEIKLDMWGQIEPEFYSHIYTDRLLYLPGETVNIKGVLRKSKDLSIPLDNEFTLKINDSNGKEILDRNLSLNEYGSFSGNIDLPDSSSLGYYNITLLDGTSFIGGGSFSVEVFKNPKFQNEVVLETELLNGELVEINDKEVIEHRYWDETNYTGNFKIKGKVLSAYYNGAKVKNANFTYKVYKQYYYENSYWDNCYYGCYWEPQKEFYTEGKGKLNENGVGSFEINIDFKSSYSDYKYIVEVTVTDSVGDTISGSNSIIAKLPNEYKKYNKDLSVNFTVDNKFIKSGNDIEINGGLNVGRWTEDYNNKYLFVIKKKQYSTVYINDVRGIERPITQVSEKLEKVMFVNDDNFSPTLDGRLRLNYELDNVGEYVFEYGVINYDKKIDLEKLLKDYNENKVTEYLADVEKKVEMCDIKTNSGMVINEERENNCETVNQIVKESIKIDDLFTDKKYFSVLTYGDTDGSNPIVDDNKIKVIPEKISYNLGEKAKVLIRLPFSKGKILWTIEKQGVVKSEYIDITSNVFFKEIDVDDTFIPNAYIGVVAIEVDGKNVPEYKVGYSEIVVDKTDKKSYITIKPYSNKYMPRDTVNIDLLVQDKNNNPVESELTVMVVDDSLISLLGNVDLNTLEKFYKKLPFQIQTSITNIAMLRNYYFSRPGIVGGSGFGNFKGGDSAVSSRNIFKNTAYFNPSVITDKDGKAKVSFTLPDNLTNFRIMVVSNSKDNLFGYAEENIEVRKNVILEDKTPIILRDGDISSIGANLFNTTDKDIGFKLELKSNIEVKDPVKNIIVKAGESVNTIWEVKVTGEEKEIQYTISALGDSTLNSDKIENVIKIKESPDLINSTMKNSIIQSGQNNISNIKIPENTDINKSNLVVSVSNTKLTGIKKIVSSLAVYPYGCIEQTTSSTLPNAILKKFDNIFNGIIEDKDKIDGNIEYGIERITSMQTSDGGFAYWEGYSQSDLHITPYVTRSLIDMKEYGIELPEGLLENSIKYLENNFVNAETDLEKTEILWALAKYNNGYYIGDNLEKLGINNLTDTFENKDLDRHSLIALTYSLVLTSNDKYKSIINENIEKIKELINDNETHSRYRNKYSDKAIFVSLLMDYNYSKSYIDELIEELYKIDWSSYYYSTQSKNNSFMAFAKYIEKYSKENNSKFSFFIGNKIRENNIEIGGIEDNYYEKTYNLGDIIGNIDDININFEILLGGRLYLDITLKSFPKDKTKIKTYSNGINVKREYYEVIDENDTEEKCSWNNGNYNCIEAKGLKLVDGKEFKKGVLYKSKITVDMKNNSNTRNLVIEDYLAGSFRIINSKFNTEQISTKQNNNWTWNHVEFNPDVVMANASYVWGGSSSFEYYFRPEFGGEYTLPPAVAYMMYNPQIRANTEFSVISVK